MAKLVADFVLERLREWGVHRVYGYPGDGINALLGAFDRAEGDPDFVQVRHEEMAAFMACGHAKWTEEIGVCVATSGPGAIHLLNGLYDAKLDHQPVLAIVGQQDQKSLGGSYQQEVDLITLFKDVAAEYTVFVTDPAQMRHAVDRAMLIGQGAIGASEEVKEIADVLGAGVAKALLGKAALPDDLPYVTGSIGLLGTKPSWDLMQEADTLLMVGSSFPYSEFLPEEGAARGMQMNGNAELVTAAKYWQEWSDPRLIVAVLNNQDLNQVTWEQRVLEGDPMYPDTQRIPDFPYARYAELIGFRGIRVDDPNEIGGAWEEALSADRPVVLEAVTDPTVPPLPPHITIEQAKQLAAALFKGEPEAWEVIKRSFAGKAKEFVVR